jgi:nucleoside-diphosphate-sugar epimerase
MQQQAGELVSYLNASPVRRLVMVSSTGVYASRQQDADETDPHPPETENGKGLVAMESMLLDGLKASVAVVRMAGLFGPGRNPGRFLSGRQASGNGEEPVNMIHLEDAIGVIQELIEQPELTGIYNACAGEHPTRSEFYRRASELSGRTPPVLDAAEPRPWKRIISEKIRAATGYRFVYDNPVDGLRDV